MSTVIKDSATALYVVVHCAAYSWPLMNLSKYINSIASKHLPNEIVIYDTHMNNVS